MKVLGTLIVNPDGMGIEDLATASDYAVSGGFKNILATLRTAGLIIGRNTETMKATEEFFG